MAYIVRSPQVFAERDEVTVTARRAVVVAMLPFAILATLCLLPVVLVAGTRGRALS